MSHTVCTLWESTNDRRSWLSNFLMPQALSPANSGESSWTRTETKAHQFRITGELFFIDDVKQLNATDVPTAIFQKLELNSKVIYDNNVSYVLRWVSFNAFLYFFLCLQSEMKIKLINANYFKRNRFVQGSIFIFIHYFLWKKKRTKVMVPVEES